MNRRTVLKSGLSLAGALCLPPWFAEEAFANGLPEEPQSPNDKPGILLVGCGGMGRGDARKAAKFGNIVAVCDVDSNRLGEAGNEFKAEGKYGDFRKAVAHKGVDVVINGTPDHWHTLINIHALRAGKDVYSEKPLTLTIDEGRKLVAVARETKRILQTGSQQRSDARFRLACELVRNGRIGKLQQIVTTLPTGLVGGPFEPKPVPPELDWDFWLGQAPLVEYVPERSHVKFRFWYDYSGGTLTDWGAHHVDIAQWGNGTERSGPISVEGKVLESPVPGGYTAVAHFQLEYQYANGVRLLCKNVVHETFTGGTVSELKKTDERNGVRFEGTDGWIFVTRGAIAASQPELLSQELPAGAPRLYASSDHMGNFFECVRSRKPAICEPEIGHRSVSVCHLGAIALRTGRKLSWDPERETFVGDAEANGYVAREMRKPWSYESV
ncbi:MAG TPA: Gfo/Idh/MocA family oxidoreductase [Planctomycetaceae bacterium]|nr:Gfo/Idh/MocA family oxidoreductase [Planctomycetaceae bacterium]